MRHALPLRAYAQWLRMTRSCVLWLCMLWAVACAHAPSPVDARNQAERLDDGGVYAVAVLRPLRTGEHLMLEVELGTTGAGMQLVLRTLDGRLVGTVSPHGIRHGGAAGTYLVPVPDSLLQGIADDTRWRLQVRIESSAAAPRPADAQTVRAIRAVIVPE